MKKGLMPIKAAFQLLIASLAKGRYSVQSSYVYVMNTERYASMTWFFYSVDPSVSGWYAVDKR